MPDLRALCILARTPQLSREQLCAALDSLGDLDALFARSEAALRDAGISRDAARWLAAPDPAIVDADLAACARFELQLIAATDARYPLLLARTIGAPPVLWVRGDADTLSLPQLAMVGSRNPTAAGARTAHEFAHYFAESGLAIASGLALGIDAASHDGCLVGGGKTLAVCGTGLDAVYPRANAALADRIARDGALVSEFPPGTPPLKANFPQRNRLISALSLGTLVVEAARGSGSLITARCAAEQGRDVFAIPGSIHSPLSRGCHQLIRSGAKLVEEAADVISELDFSDFKQMLRQPVPSIQAAPGGPPRLDKDYEILLDALGFGPTSIDDLVARTGLPSDSVASMLLILELQGRVEPHPGGRYSRRPDRR